MLAIPPAIGRARLQQTAAGLRLVIPFQRSWFAFFHAPLAVVFIVWYLQQVGEDSKVVLGMMGLMGTVLFGRWLWNLLGREIVTVNKAALTVRWDCGGLGWQRIYFLNRVWAMSFVRLATISEMKEGSDSLHVGFIGFDYADPVSRMERWLGVAAALLRIAYDPENLRFGKGLSEDEVRELIGVMESYSGHALSSTHVPPPRPLHGRIIAEETNSNWGVTYVMGMMAGVVYYFGTLLDSVALRYGAYLASLFFAGVGILALAGYRYRFTRRGIEISTLGFRVRFIPVERITHYEESARAFADSYNFGIYGPRRAYVWAGRGVRIQTLDGEFFLGHMKSDVLLRDMETMKASDSDKALGHATGGQ